ncbi:MAG: MarR family transcriptional regulator, partial [Myxococcota bacterium]
EAEQYEQRGEHPSTPNTLIIKILDRVNKFSHQCRPNGSMTRHDPPSPSALVAQCRALYAAIDRLDQEASARAGVTRSDLRALNQLEQGPVRAGRLAEALGLSSGAVSTLIDRLERRGLARRERDPDDRRVVLVAPEPRMFELLAPLYRSVAERIGALAESYDPSELRAALAHLRDVTEAYQHALGED